MGVKTNIQYVDDTVNATSGCQGCELWHLLNKGPCYAGHLQEWRLSKTLPDLYSPNFTEVRLIPGRMAKAASHANLRGIPRPDKPWLGLMPRMIFIGDLGDVFSAAVPFDYLADELIGVATSPKGARHIWLVLTKQPSRLLAFSKWLRAERGIDWPENVWVGTSVTSSKTLGRIESLLQVPAARRFISAEPLWEEINIKPYLKDGEISWVIIGGQSDQPGWPARSMDVAWVRRLIYDALMTCSSPFIKQFGSRPTGLTTRLRDSHGGDWDEWPSDLRVRQVPSDVRFDGLNSDETFRLQGSTPCP